MKFYRMSTPIFFGGNNLYTWAVKWLNLAILYNKNVGHPHHHRRCICCVVAAFYSFSNNNRSSDQTINNWTISLCMKILHCSKTLKVIHQQREQWTAVKKFKVWHYEILKYEKRKYQREKVHKWKCTRKIGALLFRSFTLFWRTLATRKHMREMWIVSEWIHGKWITNQCCRINKGDTNTF